MLHLTECPRDAMQGIKTFIPTEHKTEYINSILKAGFRTVDFGSFVSPKAIPQMRDTAEVLANLDLEHTQSRLLAIIGNRRGGETAVSYPEITYLGFPFSVSEVFLQRNINSSLEKSFQTARDLLELSGKNGKELRLYISMAFGNLYNEPWSQEILQNWVDKLASAGFSKLWLSDTVGVGTEQSIGESFRTLVPAYPDVEFGLHLHTTSEKWYEKIDAAYQHGCRSFDGVLSGLGGCPMAGPRMVGNVMTSDLLSYFQDNDIQTPVDMAAFNQAVDTALRIMPAE